MSEEILRTDKRMRNDSDRSLFYAKFVSIRKKTVNLSKYHYYESRT